jgi:hypothetical protein
VIFAEVDPGSWSPAAGDVSRVDSTHDAGMVYRIRVRGRLSPRVAKMFPGFEATQGDGFTDLVGPIEDQAQLYGVLEQIRSLGLTLVEATPLP